MKKGKVIGIISIKGGVGKTTVVSNLGATLARKFNKKVLLVDGNTSAPNLGLHLGMLDSENTLHDVLYSQVPIWNAIRKSEYGFDVVTSALVPKKGQTGRMNPYKLHNRLSQVKADYDYIIVDSSPNLNEEMLSTMIASDSLVVVTSPDYPTLSCTMHAIKVAKERKTPIVGLVLNKVRGKKFELSVKEIEDATGVPVLSVIKDDVKMLESLSKTRPATAARTTRNINDGYASLASRLSGEECSSPGLFSRLLGK
ncbi:AAA family ATPase [Candidatus Woesearchaeota archaeon]|nr:AAA family ATPase [Candidatus Woesearchaeota archaeon]